MKGGEKMQETNEMRDRLINEFAENYMEKLFYFCLKKTGSASNYHSFEQRHYTNKLFGVGMADCAKSLFSMGE